MEYQFDQGEHIHQEHLDVLCNTASLRTWGYKTKIQIINNNLVLIQFGKLVQTLNLPGGLLIIITLCNSSFTHHRAPGTGHRAPGTGHRAPLPPNQCF